MLAGSATKVITGAVTPYTRPKLQVTVCAVLVQVPSVEVAETKDNPVGSVIVATVPSASKIVRFSTVMV